MKKNIMMYKKVFWNIALPGKLFENNEKTGANALVIRYILMNLMFITGFCVLSFFLIEAFLQNSYSDLVLTASMFFLCFIAWPVAEEIQTALKENACAVTIVAMAEYGKKIPRGCRELYMPTQPVMVAHILNKIGKIVEKKGSELTVNHGTEKTVSTSRSDPSLSPRPFHVRLSALKEALERKDIKKIDRLLEELEKNPLDAKIREDLDAVSDKVLMGDYQDAVEAVAEMMSLAPELRLRENAS